MSSDKTPTRQGGEPVSREADPNKILNKPSQELLDAAGDPIVSAMDAMKAAEEEPKPKGKGGRPKGARNKRSKALQDWVKQQYGLTPGHILAATALHGLDEYLEEHEDPGGFMAWRASKLEKELGITKKEAFAAIQDAMKAALPYTNAKLAPAKESTERPILVAFRARSGDLDGSDAQSEGVLPLTPANLLGPGEISKNDKKEAKSDGKSRTDD